MGVETKTHIVQDIISYMDRQFGDDSSVQINTADIVRWINLGQREIFENNPTLNQTSASTDIVANQNTYPLTTDPNLPNVRLIRSVRYQGQVLLGFTRQEAEQYLLYNNVLYPAPPAGIPTNWWLDDGGKLLLYPTPMTAVPSGLLIHYNAYPKTVSAATDSLDIPDSYYHVLLNYVMSQVYELDENWAAAKVKRDEWRDTLNTLSNRTEVEEDHFPTILLDPEDSVY